MKIFFWEILDEDYELVETLNDTIVNSQDLERIAQAQAKANELGKILNVTKNDDEQIIETFTIYPQL